MLRAVPTTAGVIVFFLLSGFLNTLTSIRKSARPAYDYKVFVAERFFRIFTPYVPALIFVAIVDAVSVQSPAYPHPENYTLATWLANLAMLQDYPLFSILRRLGVPDQPWFFTVFGSAGPFWTLTIEWWIYLCFGFGLFLTRGDFAWSWRNALILGFFAIVPFHHFIGGYGQCLTMIWGLGMAFAIWHEPIARRFASLHATRRGRTGLWLGLFVLVLAVTGRLYFNRFRIYELQVGAYISALAFFVYFWVGCSAIRFGEITEAAGKFLADFSYSLYLTHAPIVILLVTYVKSGQLERSTALWAALVGANAFAIAFWAAFERHHRRVMHAVRERFGAASLQRRA
jgi:peptidoglycan/LPS O-acetylase OafA/YrhL